MVKHNKVFKRDSQRLAFSVQIGFCVYGAIVEFGGRVVHPLTRRYAAEGDKGLELES